MPTFNPNQPSVTVNVPVPTPVPGASQSQPATPVGNLAQSGDQPPPAALPGPPSPTATRVPAHKPHALIFPMLLD